MTRQNRIPSPLSSTLFSLLWLLLFIGLGACNENAKNQPAPPAPPTGPVTEAEIKAATLPTYGQLYHACDSLTGANPTLLRDETAMARAVFNWVKANPNGKASAEQPTQSSHFDLVYALQLAKKITRAELSVFVAQPKNFYDGRNAVKAAYAAAAVKFPCDLQEKGEFDNSKANAVLHAYWNALLVRRFGLPFAEQWANARESESPKEAANTAMDLHNNKFGRDFAVKYPKATDEELLIMLTEQKFVFIARGESIPAGTEGLVYILAQRPYDVTMTGTITNPDSGGPWQIAFNFNQCGSVIRGQYTIVRGAAMQKRRFEGVINPDKSMSLNVSQSYVFENPDYMNECMGMKMTLTGNERALKGKWTSSNCYLGGVVDVTVSK